MIPKYLLTDNGKISEPRMRGDDPATVNERLTEY